MNDSQAATAAGDSRPRGLGQGPPALAIRHLSKSFGRSVVLDDVTLTVRPGEIWGLLGLSNGSGKSTLIKILAGYHAPDPGGELDVHGEPVRLPLSAGQWRELGSRSCIRTSGCFPSVSVLDNLTGRHLPRLAPGADPAGTRAQGRMADAASLQRGPRARPQGGLARPAPNGPMVAIVRAADELRRWDAAASHEHGAAGGARGVLVLYELTRLPAEGRDRTPL